MNKLYTCLAIVVALFSILGGLYSYDKEVVKTKDLFVVSEDLRLLKKQYSIDGDSKRVREIDLILYTMEQRYQGKSMPITVKETKRRLEMELKELLHKLGRSS